jgi:hypothetical protein
MTGLREYGWFKKTFGFSSSKIPGVGAIKKIAKPIIKTAKQILASPIGRIVATIALTTFLGPTGAAMGGGFFGAATAAGVAGTSIGLLSGESLKDSLISGATAYFGAPGGPVANFVGKAGITSIAGQAAAASGLVGATVGLARGQSLKDSIKSGLTQAAISGGSAIVSNYMAQADGSKSLMDAVNKQAPVLTPEGVLKGDRAPDGNQSAAPADLNAPKISGFGTGNDKGNPLYGPDAGFPVAGSNTTPTAMDPAIAARAARGDMFASANTAPAAAYDPSGYIDPLKKIGSGIMDIGQGNFEQGFKDLTGGAGDLFMPSGPTPEQIQTGKLQAYKTALVQGEQAGLKGDALTNFASESMKTYTSPGPGMVRSYAPLAAAGLGATALMGGFEPPETPDSQMKQDMYGTPGLDRINADPNKYIIQNLPGVNYTEQGNIAGSGNWSPGQTLDDIRVSGNTTSGRNLRGNIYTPPMYSPTGSGGGGIAQPYNQRNKYDFMPRYAAQGGMMSGGIANLAGGGYPRRTGQIEGPGTEKSDSIPAMLSDGEFVMTAGAVRGAGNGSRRAGAKKMYALMHQLEQNAARG